MGYQNGEFQEESGISATEGGSCKRKLTLVECVMIGFAALGALCLLPLVSSILTGLVELVFGLLGGVLGLIAGLVSLVLGLALGAVGLVIGLLAGLASLLVSPPGLVLIAIVLYCKYSE